MLTITQAWLDMFPSWVDEGWIVNDTLNLCTYLAGKTSVQNAIAEHPPHRPSEPK